VKTLTNGFVPESKNSRVGIATSGVAATAKRTSDLYRMSGGVRLL